MKGKSQSRKKRKSLQYLQNGFRSTITIEQKNVSKTMASYMSKEKVRRNSIKEQKYYTTQVFCVMNSTLSS